EGEPRTVATGGDGRGEAKERWQQARMAEGKPRTVATAGGDWEVTRSSGGDSSAVVNICAKEAACSDVSADDVDENPKLRSAYCCASPLSGMELLMNIANPYITAGFLAPAIASSWCCCAVSHDGVNRCCSLLRHN
uniref:Uncharacterized protein n=1 Tax=Oryza glaberrima TaxID=4538 RepID=I1NMJ2_ORYGL